MRISVSHKKGRQEAMRIIDQTADDLFRGVIAGPVQLVDQKKSWNGSTMTFSFVGKMGFFTAPFNGTVEVTETEAIVDVELPGFLKNFLPEEKVRAEVQSRVRGLLT